MSASGASSLAYVRFATRIGDYIAHAPTRFTFSGSDLCTHVNMVPLLSHEHFYGGHNNAFENQRT